MLSKPPPGESTDLAHPLRTTAHLLLFGVLVERDIPACWISIVQFPTRRDVEFHLSSRTPTVEKFRVEPFVGRALAALQVERDAPACWIAIAQFPTHRDVAFHPHEKPSAPPPQATR
jgi:hypothetical protein